MPASGVNLYQMQDAKNNFNAVRPIPMCDESNYFPSHNIHISTNCYYGYHDQQPVKHVEAEDCEMKEINSNDVQIMDESRSHCIARKRGAADFTHTQNKRLRKEVQTKNTYEPETKRVERRTEDSLMETLYWNLHGGTLFTYNSCD